MNQFEQYEKLKSNENYQFSKSESVQKEIDNIVDGICGRYEGTDSTGRQMFLDVDRNEADATLSYSFGLLGFRATNSVSGVSLDELMPKLWAAVSNGYKKTSETTGGVDPIKAWLR